MNNIAIFASGSGTNAENIIRFFRPSDNIAIKIIASNNPLAKVLERAANHDIQHFSFTREQFYKTDFVLQELEKSEIDFIVLAGFLWLVPENLTKKFANRIINIHPALLPEYGGKGMYGAKVHEAIIKNREKKSGISIHYVNERYDEGNLIFQTTCPVNENDTPEMLASKIHELEYEHYPRVIEEVITHTSQKPLS